MRSAKSVALLGLGVFLVVLAAMLRFYGLPHLEKQPLDFYFTDVSTGPGTYFDVATLSVKGPEQVTVTRTERGDVKAGNGKVAVWDIFTRVNGESGNLIQATQERWAFDRKTGKSVSGYGENPPHAGNFLVWPFNAPKQTTMYWDQVAKQAFPARYVGTEKLQGHTVYRYTSVIPPTKIGSTELPGALVGQKDKPSVMVDEYYANPDSSALVDPRTGAVVGGSSHQIVTLRLPGSSTDALTFLDMNVTATAATTKGLLKKANDGAKQLTLIGTVAPLVSLLLGLVCLVLAAIFYRRAATDAAYRSEVPGGTPEQRTADIDVPAEQRHYRP